VELVVPGLAAGREVGARGVPAQARRGQAGLSEVPELRPAGEDEEEAGRGRPPRRPDQAASSGCAEVGQQRDPGRHPDPVVVPAQRRSSRPVRAQASMAGTGCRARYSSAGGGQPGDRDQDGRHDPGHRALRNAAGQPGQHAAQRLVAPGAQEDDPVGLQEQPVRPVRAGVTRQERVAERRRGREHAGGRGGLPVPADEQQVRDEDQRGQLHARRDPDADAVPPAGLAPGDQRAGGEQVRHDQQHEQQVDLAEGEGLLDGFGGQRQCGDPERRPEPDRGPVAVPERAEHQPQRQAEGGQAGQRHRPPHGRPGQHGATAKITAANGG
jgi:hypothetical protein